MVDSTLKNTEQVKYKAVSGVWLFWI